MKRARRSKSNPPITGDELERMPHRGRCELVRGTIVHADPTSRGHARVEVRFAREIGEFVERRGLGDVLAGEAGIYTRRGPDTVRGADVAFLSAERAARCRPDGFLDVAPDLVVEVRSPGDRPEEVEEKIEEYLSAGVRLVWEADPAAKTVRVHRPGGSPGPVEASALLTENDTLSGEDVLPGFAVPVRRFFAP